ncbi:MAG: urease accessory protein UreF [Acetobacteraceae bacterium]|nr:urease accessory protein UreF [Acetobacteraceae bacterium]
MTTSPPTLTDPALLRLLAWLSPAFPTGAFAYSHGLEWAVEAGDVGNEVELGLWVADLLAHGAGRNDAILLRAAYRAEGVVALAEVAALARAMAPSRERRMESVLQGAAFAAAAAVWGRAPEIADPPYPVAVGAYAQRHGVAEDAACLAFLQAFGANLVSAALRLIPLGQTAGLRVVAALEPVVLEVAHASRSAALDDIGGDCFRSDIGSMRHETQYTRLFRS